ncbi:MAG: DUF3488 and transglutaminase-like domain-containing protein [Lautropia sp.]|nr:DUF3488 and transglutaminase-like domain-containing protein [Lautropia sp.]
MNAPRHPPLPTGLRPSLRALGGRLGDTWERDRRDTLLLLGAVLLAVLPHTLYLPFWCTASFALLFVWRLGLLISGHPLPGRGVRMLASVAVVGAVYAQFHTLLGQEAGVVLVLLFLGLKLLEMRTRRDFYITVFLGFFLLLAAYLHSQEILMGLWTLLAVPALLAVLLTIQYQQAEVPMLKRLCQAAVLMLQALPLATLLFVLFPRPGGPLWGNQDQRSSGTTGLSNSMAPGDFSSLAESNAVVMRVSFDGPAPTPADMYWRGPSFGMFDGRRWTALPPDTNQTLPPPSVQLPAHDLGWHYTITREPDNNHWLLGLDTVTDTPEVAGEVTAVLPTMEWVRQSPLTERVLFSAQSHPQARTGLNETASSLAPWRQLPAGFNPRTLALAHQWRQQIGDDPHALAEQVLNWIRQEPFRYTLSPPKLGRDSIDDFLFHSRAGFCEHYSSAFVFLMRAMGVPARVVTGYQGAEHHAEDNYWIVRQANAHAWAEIWHPQQGWLRADPTAAVAPERIEQGSLQALRQRQQSDLVRTATDLTHHWMLSLDSITHHWNLWLLSYDRNRQRRLLDRLGLSGDGWQTLAGVMAATLALALAVTALVTLRTRPLHDPVERAFSDFCRKLAAIGAERLPHETANQFLYRIERLLDADNAALAHDIVATYNQMRYDPGTSGPGERLNHLRKLVGIFHP